ncbi:hypothetical protein K7711_12345 [Nocardia sp. CA2R105]|uniref:hypothetical protein n=1 Tax=Nocardia coffeae TaxID=2873381 RepID=UPI001CA621F0|nr:hypothetical protein [Nocardia coffeae]MBY8857271.1 hypothetical protein [Nocardia coffeae]
MAAQHRRRSTKRSGRGGSLLVAAAVLSSGALFEAAPAMADASKSPTATSRNDTNGKRAVPDGALAPVDPSRLHLPTALAPPVAPIQAPDGTLRIGSAQIGRPDWVDPKLAEGINDSFAQQEATLAQGFDSVGFDPARSDRMAGDAMVGSLAGNVTAGVLTSPLTSTSAAVGAVAGFISGIPFLPAGLVVMPVVGALIGAAVIAVPAAVVGSGIGAGAGALEGALAPATVPSPSVQHAPPVNQPARSA